MPEDLVTRSFENAPVTNQGRSRWPRPDVGSRAHKHAQNSQIGADVGYIVTSELTVHRRFSLASVSLPGPGGRGLTSLAGRHGADNSRDHQPLGAAWQERNSRSPDCSDPQSILTCARPRLTVIAGADQAFLDQVRARGDVSLALVAEVLDAGTHHRADTVAALAGGSGLRPGQDMARALLKSDTDRVVAALINVLHRVGAVRFHPAHPHGGRGSGVLRGLKLHSAARVIPDPGRLVDDHHARRPVRVLGFAGSRLDHYLEHPYPVVLQKDVG